MTVAELIDSGAHVSINYHQNDEQQAESKIRPFLSLGSVEVINYDDRRWLSIHEEKISVSAFIDKKS